jgi:hypothetical protein
MTRLRGNHSRSSNEPTGTVAYICTGRGDHAPVGGLGKLTGQRPGELRCPLCGLTKRIGYRARQRIRAAGLTQVDVSALPF